MNPRLNTRYGGLVPRKPVNLTVPSECIIEQLAGHLGLSKEHLIAAAGLWPTDLREKLPGSDPQRVEKAFTAFRKVLKDKP